MSWKIVLAKTGETLASGFASIAEADAWHDGWLDQFPDADFEDLDKYPSVHFVQEQQNLS